MQKDDILGALQKLQPMAALGALVLQVNDETQNLLAEIGNHTKLLLEHVNDKEYIEKYVNLVGRNIQKITEIRSQIKYPD